MHHISYSVLMTNWRVWLDDIITLLMLSPLKVWTGWHEFPRSRPAHFALRRRPSDPHALRPEGPCVRHDASAVDHPGQARTPARDVAKRNGGDLRGRTDHSWTPRGPSRGTRPRQEARGPGRPPYSASAPASGRSANSRSHFARTAGGGAAACFPL